MSRDAHLVASIVWVMVGGAGVAGVMAGLTVFAPVVLVAGLCAGLHAQKA